MRTRRPIESGSLGLGRGGVERSAFDAGFLPFCLVVVSCLDLISPAAVLMLEL